MLTEDDLAWHCPARTFQRALQIASREKNMLTKQVRYDAGATTLTAFVAASSGWADRYRTSVEIDEDAGEVLDYSCTCPAFLKYDGMCKHAVALALTYLDDPRSFIGYKSSRTPETSPSVAAFMQRAERLAAESELSGSVSLEATLSYGYENWTARFKVRGPRGSYVMKSVGAFVEAVRTRERVTYGKKLAFTHAPSAFDEQGQALVRFLERAVARREQAFGAMRWHSFAAPCAGRDLDLSDGEVIELIDLLACDSIPIECTDGSLPRSTRAHVVDADPHVPLRIVRQTGGYVIMRDEDVAFAAEGSRMYVLQDGMLFCCSPGFARCADFLRSVYRSADDQLFVADDDMPLFCAAVLPTLEETLAVDAPAELELLKPVPARLEFYFDYLKGADLIEVDALARYGESAFALAKSPSTCESERAAEKEAHRAAGRGEDAPSLAPLRDEVLERRALSLVQAFFDADNTLPLADDRAAGSLLFGGLSQFRELGEVFTTPAFDRLISDKKPRVSMGLSIAGNLINLDVSASDLDAGELAALLASYRRRKRFHRLRSGAFVDMADHDLSELNRLVDDLGISAAALKSGHVELPTYRALYLDRELSDARRDESFSNYVERLRSIDQASYEVPPALAHVLRPYQREGFRWLSSLADMGFSGILADEMGLGKSVQLISFLLARAEAAREVGPSLIVCPASLVYNWLAEFSAFAPALEVRAVGGSRGERERIRAERGVDVLVTSYDLARIDERELEETELFCCVLDEAQYIKNHATLTTRAVKRLHARHRFALTGTPVENRLSEIWSIFDFLMPGFLGSYERFRKRFELGILGGDEDLARRLQSLVGPFVLRRRKDEVLPDLPDKLENAVYVSLGREQRRLYDAAEQQLRQELNAQKKTTRSRSGGPVPAKSRVEVLAALTRLRQIALDPALLYENYRGGAAKMGAIVEMVEQARDAGTKALVFSQFTSYLELIAAELEARGVPCFRITGATPKKKRVELVSAFNADDTPAFLISLKAGGTGLNLTGATVVIHADPWWNAAATDQATDRAHRIGQKSTVSVYKVIAKGTVEERILRLQDAKVKLAESVIGGAASSGAGLANLTREELLDLLEG